MKDLLTGCPILAGLFGCVYAAQDLSRKERLLVLIGYFLGSLIWALFIECSFPCGDSRE